MPPGGRRTSTETGRLSHAHANKALFTYASGSATVTGARALALVLAAAMAAIVTCGWPRVRPGGGQVASYNDDSLLGEAFTHARGRTSPSLAMHAEMNCTAASRKDEQPGWPNGTLVHVVHVQKAAGSSVNAMLREWAKLAGLQYHELNRWRATEPLVFNSMEGIVIGHSPWGLAVDAPPRRLSAVLLRSPVSRFVSQVHYYNKTFCSHPERATARPECRLWANSSLEQLLDEYRHARAHNPELLVRATRNTARLLFAIHSMLYTQLGSVAGPECWPLPPARWDKPSPTWLRYYAKDRAVEFNFRAGFENASCSVASMKRKAMAHLRATDVIMSGCRGVDSFVDQLRFHTSFVPDAVAPPAVNVAESANYQARMLTPRVLLWLGEWLADEQQVFDLAVRLETQKLDVIGACSA